MENVIQRAVFNDIRVRFQMHTFGYRAKNEYMSTTHVKDIK